MAGPQKFDGAWSIAMLDAVAEYLKGFNGALR